MKPNTKLRNRPAIYAIRNKTTGKFYVGKTGCMYKRCHQYIYDLRERRIGHINDYLYNAICKYGIQDFEMIPLEFAAIDELSELELQWMKVLDSTNRRFGYNLRMDSSTGMITSPETSKKISDNLKGQWARGERSGHSQKLKDAWASNPERVKSQGELFSKLKTVWSYVVTFPDGSKRTMNYKDLKGCGLGNCLSEFHRKKTDSCRYKGHAITRIKSGSCNNG